MLFIVKKSVGVGDGFRNWWSRALLHTICTQSHYLWAYNHTWAHL